ncbi:MAG: indole-3-glycerol phosphate synthase TrpC [Anaerolineales bacterium]|nr:indole-3-glycerol phosphate synthase TrpC [Anaerolineales bacterium]
MILDEIIAHKRQEVEHQQHAVPLSNLVAAIDDLPPPLDFHQALSHGVVSLIAEVKRASPSRGVLRTDLDPADLASIYAVNGASAISVLTDQRFFQGSLADLAKVRQALSGKPPGIRMPPILRKDFILVPYQVFESRAGGADAILLIAAILTDRELADLYALARELGMSVLVEVHDREELTRALRFTPRIIGINNRNLHNFSVDLQTFGSLHRLIPENVVSVAESGIHTARDVQLLAEMSADAILVGEALVTAGDTAGKIRELVGRQVGKLVGW